MSEQPLPWGEMTEGLRQSTAALAELGILTSSLLHELRQPVFAIKATAQLATARSHDEAEISRMQRILEQLQQIERLIDYYGSVGRVDEPERLYDLNEPVRNALEMLAHRRRNLGAEVETLLAPEALLVRGRSGAIKQVALNLLQNAYDAVEEVDKRQIRVQTSRRGERLRLEVVDSGPGVAEHVRERILEPFFTTKPLGRGTGLGLYIANRIVRANDGWLVVDRTEAGHTRVVIELPPARPEGV